MLAVRTAVLVLFLELPLTCIKIVDNIVIFEDLALIQPTMLSATPRLWNVFYAEYNQALTAAMTENDAKPDDQKETPQEVETRVLQRFRNMFGKRLQVIVTGGAPTSEAVLAFLKRCFGIWVENGYGTSETSGICGDSHVREDVEIKLEDVPELGYFNTDLPYPRGEVLVRSPSMFKGYWNNDQLTQESVTADGWYRTGDIAEMHPKTKRVKIIDRRKNFFKLAQGEFVAPECSYRSPAAFLPLPGLLGLTPNSQVQISKSNYWSAKQ